MEEEYQNYLKLNEPYFKYQGIKPPTYEEWVQRMTAGYATISADTRSDWQRQQAKDRKKAEQESEQLYKNQHLWNQANVGSNIRITKDNAKQMFDFNKDITNSMATTGMIASQIPTVFGIWGANPTLLGKLKGVAGYYLPEEIMGATGAGIGAGIDTAFGGNGSTGAFVGSMVGAGAANPMLARARAAAYRHITPLGYNDATGIGLGKKQEIKNMLKEIFSFKDQPTVGVRVPWIENLDAQGNLHNLYNNRIGLAPGAYIRFRDQAWRKAMRQPDLEFEPQIYKLNSDGTYSYDMDAVNKIRLETGSTTIPNPSAKDLDTKVTIDGQDRVYKADKITQNGGFVGVKKEADGDYMIDQWDLQPFKDQYRSFWPWGTKNLPFIRNIEAVEALRGNPFTLKHKLE